MKKLGPAILSFILIFALIHPASANEFSSRELLFDTVVEGLDEKDLTDAEKGEIEAKMDEWAADLTDDQVVAFNQSLNNAVHNKFSIDFSDPDIWDLLGQALENEYDFQDIVALTKALESEAKFLYLHGKTGKEFFLDKAESEKDKFLTKIDGFEFPEDPEEPGGTEPPDELVETTAKLGHFDILAFNKQELKQQLKVEARNEAKALARETSRGNIRNAAKFAARDALKEIRSETRRANSKGRNPKKSR